MSRIILALTVAATLTMPTARAQSSLPIAEEIDGKVLRAHCRRLLQALENLKSPVPAELARQLRDVLDDATLDADTVSVRLQNLLDSRCLVGISINPESRVKAVRGSLPAVLSGDLPTLVLLKVHNEAGVTHPLVVSGPEVRSPGAAVPDRWLEAAVIAAQPLGKNLSGEKVEYVVLRLIAHEKGKREATLRFDVGQGTQDLGFRAEVPILFTVR